MDTRTEKSHSPVIPDRPKNPLDARMDGICKRLISEKAVLARLLKLTVEEYRELSVEEILDRIQRHEVLIGTEALDSVTALPGKVIGANTEIHEDGAFTNFDLFLQTDTPDGAGIQLDIEIQQNESGANIEERGAYYEARMTSTQKGRYFMGSEYGKLVRSYSIWVVINPYAKWRGTIRQIRKVMEVVYPEGAALRPEDDNPAAYDKARTVIVGLPKADLEQKHSDILNTLSVLFNKDIFAQDKEQYLTKQGIIINKEYIEEVNAMCSVGYAIRQEALEEGRQEGRQEGCQEGDQKRMMKIVSAMLETIGDSKEIARILKEDVGTILNVIATLRQAKARP